MKARDCLRPNKITLFHAALTSDPALRSILGLHEGGHPLRSASMSRTRYETLTSTQKQDQKLHEAYDIAAIKSNESDLAANGCAAIVRKHEGYLVQNRG